MSNVKISALPTGTVGSTDAFPIVQGGVTKAATFGHTHPQSDVTNLTTSLSGAQSDIATLQSQVITLQSQLPVFTPLVQSTWTWFNQGSAVVTQGDALVTLLSPSATGTNIRGRLRGNYPSGTTTLIVVLRPWSQIAGSNTNLGVAGVTISDGTKHKIFVAANFNFNTAAPPQSIWVGRYNTATSASSATVVDSLDIASNTTVWLKMVDDGVNQTFSYSFDGQGYVQVLQESRTAFLTPSDIGICITCQSASQTQGGTFLSWSSS
jgi:hypothetical protein